MSSPSEKFIAEQFIGTNESVDPTLEALLKETADRCLDCGYWTLLQWLEDGYCLQCYEPEMYDAFEEW
jgi:hypothetical protein